MDKGRDNSFCSNATWDDFYLFAEGPAQKLGMWQHCMNRIFFPRGSWVTPAPQKKEMVSSGGNSSVCSSPKEIQTFQCGWHYSNRSFQLSRSPTLRGLLAWRKKAAIAQLALWTGVHVDHGTLVLHHVTKILFHISENLITCKLFSLLLQNNPPILGK